MVEERVVTGKRDAGGSRRGADANRSVPQRVSEIKAGDETRIHMLAGELNRVRSGGLESGTMVLVGGEP